MTWWDDAEHARASLDQLPDEPRMTRAEALADAVELGDYDARSGLWRWEQDAGRVTAGFVTACFLFTVFFAGLLLLGVEARCHHTPSLCERPTTSQETRP